LKELSGRAGDHNPREIQGQGVGVVRGREELESTKKRERGELKRGWTGNCN